METDGKGIKTMDMRVERDWKRGGEGTVVEY
jgi:hypothetical protein